MIRWIIAITLMPCFLQAGVTVSAVPLYPEQTGITISAIPLHPTQTGMTVSAIPLHPKEEDLDLKKSEPNTHLLKPNKESQGNLEEQIAHSDAASITVTTTQPPAISIKKKTLLKTKFKNYKRLKKKSKKGQTRQI